MFRDVCSSGLLQNPITLGIGCNTDTIEIDESCLEYKENTTEELEIKSFGCLVWLKEAHEIV